MLGSPKLILASPRSCLGESIPRFTMPPAVLNWLGPQGLQFALGLRIVSVHRRRAGARG